VDVKVVPSIADGCLPNCTTESSGARSKFFKLLTWPNLLFGTPQSVGYEGSPDGKWVAVFQLGCTVSTK